MSASQVKNYDENKKICCAYHKTQFLTNFCADKNCLMPLCPSCIVDHTQQHYKESSKPLYMNLHDGLYDVKESCLAGIQDFQEFARKLVLFCVKQREIGEFKKKLIQEVHNQLLEHKQNIYNHVERIFTQFQHQVYSIIVNDYENEGLYREDDINEYQIRVDETVNQLYQKIGQIKSEQCLAAMIMFYGSQRERINGIRNECQKFVNRHDDSKIDTLLDEDAMKKQLNGLFQNVVQIKKIATASKKYEPIQHVHSQQIQQRTPDRNNRAGPSHLSQSKKSRIFHNSDSKYQSPPRNFDVSNRKQKMGHQSGFR